MVLSLLSVIPVFAGNGSGDRMIAFPTAEGYGKYTVGGRGGKVIAVTNLNDSGPGSLRAAVNEGGPRTVVFRVSGNIELSSNIAIKNPYITIAGQTAPGGGICLKGGSLSIDANQVIIRHIRVRYGDINPAESDAVGSRGQKNVILDHISASWSVDETMSVYGCDSITVQWCMITESMFYSHHVKGAHGFGGIWGSNHSSYHHNLLAHHASRNPRFASNAGYTDYRNNVIYNWGYNSCYGGEFHDPYNPQPINCTYINMVNNYYKPGPATTPGSVSYRIANPSYRDSMADYGKWYINGNYMYGNQAVTQDNWSGGVQMSGSYSYCRQREPWPAMPINEQTAEQAYALVLANAGATLPDRDVIDCRIVEEVEGGYALYEGPKYKELKTVADNSVPCGIIDSQEDVGGWPVLQSLPAPADTDVDGMPDSWEEANGLDPKNPSDRNRLHTSGYTALEVYLNELCGEYVEGEFEPLPENPEGDKLCIYWRLGENDNYVLEGPKQAVEVLSEKFQGLELDRYTSPNAAAVWPAHTGWDASRKTQRVRIPGGSWPGESEYVADRYVEFGLVNAGDQPILVDTVSLFVCGCGTNGLQCNVLYSVNDDFSSPVMIGDFSAKGSFPNSVLQEVVVRPDRLLQKNDRILLRIFPWSRGALSNKTICLSDVVISGVIVKPSSVVSPGREQRTTFGIYSVSGIRKASLSPGLNIVRYGDGRVEKIFLGE